MSQVPPNPYAAPAGFEEFGGAAQNPVGVRASRGSRLGARALDWLVMLMAMVPGIALLVVLAPDEDGVIAGMVVMLALPFMVACFNWFLIARTGQTIGKRAVGIRVLRQDGSPVGFLHGVVLREWVPIGAAQVVPFAGLIDVVFIFADEQRCVHDLLANTDVFAASNRAF